MLDYRIIPADESHLATLAAGMRAADRREVWASHRDTPLEALRRCLRQAERAWTVIVDGRPVLMWGVARGGSVLSDLGVPWLLGTDELDKCWVEFLKQSRLWVDLMQEGFDRLENYVQADNRLSIRWLKWCGFSLAGEAVEINGKAFYKFWRDA